MQSNTLLRQHLVNLLTGKEAHADFEAAIKDLPAGARGKRPKAQNTRPGKSWNT